MLYEKLMNVEIKFTSLVMYFEFEYVLIYRAHHRTSGGCDETEFSFILKDLRHLLRWIENYGM